MSEGRSELVEALRSSGAVRFGQFTLTSGQTSDAYVDVKKASTDPPRLRLMARMLSERVGTADRLAGMELGAVPLLVATALQSGHRYAIIRKSAREHGTQQRIEGDVPKGSRVVVIEDVTTTGGSVVEAVRVLRDAGALVDRVLVVVDRGAGARERLASVGVTLEPLVSLAELREASP